ncbi:MAG TPA: response regulator [Gemmatimonadaceae bacterium]|nr:response regulator [Gemmatimonadaceae bacterium]
MTHRVLVADDDRQMVRTLCDILRMHGWDAHGVHNGNAAVEAVRAEPFALVLMDVRMEGLNGVDALKQMKSVRPGIRVLLMTAYSAAELIAEAEREGAMRVLPKPVAVPMLLDMLSDVENEPRRVLVVDDEPAFLHSLADVLRQHDYEVLEATTLDDAITQIEHEEPGAVVLDLILDGAVSGESVFAIRRVSPAVALILYSGHGPALDAVHARVGNRDIRGTLRKPFPPEQLLDLLDAAFS